METQKLESAYKIDILNLQNAYRDKLRELVGEVLGDEQFLVDYINQSVLKCTPTEQREVAS